MSVDKCFGETERLVPACIREDREAFAYKGAIACVACMSELGKRANIDKITGLPNEHALAKRFDELSAADDPFGAISFDVISFSSVNNRFGHPVGNIALEFIGKFLSKSPKRSNDIVTPFRTGGDEFAMLVPLAQAEPAEDGKRQMSMAPSERLESVRSRYMIAFSQEPHIAKYNAEAARTGNSQLGLRANAAMHEGAMSLEDLLTTADPKALEADGVATDTTTIMRMRELFSQEPQLPTTASQASWRG